MANNFDALKKQMQYFVRRNLYIVTTKTITSITHLATVILFLFLNSNILHCIPRFLSQKLQSAAPPAIVPNKNGLISIIFFTVPLAIYAPIVDRESTDTIIPPSNLNARVVVPLANLTAWPASELPQAEAKLLREKEAGS